jgi:hypothetical protein
VSVARWKDPSTIASAQAWLRTAAEEHDIVVTADITQPHVRPWSTVFRAESDHGPIYLKLCGPSQSHEPSLSALLAVAMPDLLPSLIAIHPNEPWLLMADGGAPIREALSGEDLLGAWAALLPRYALLQRALLGREKDLLATGTPDRRLERLTADLGRVIEDERVLAPLDHDDYAAGPRDLRALLPDLELRCAELAGIGIGPTIQHDDLHDANVLTRGGRTIVFDWGDACVTHPFLSLWVVQRAVAHRARLTPEHPAIARLRDAYLEPWSDLAPTSVLRRAAEGGRVLGSVTRALCWYRVATLNEGVLDEEPDVVSASLDTIADTLGNV